MNKFNEQIQAVSELNACGSVAFCGLDTFDNRESSAPLEKKNATKNHTITPT